MFCHKKKITKSLKQTADLKKKIFLQSFNADYYPKFLNSSFLLIPFLILNN